MFHMHACMHACTYRLRRGSEAIDHDADTSEQVGHCQTAGIPISHSNCALLIKLLLQLLIFIGHVFGETPSMVFHLARSSFLDAQLFALVLRFYVTVSGSGVRHACAIKGALSHTIFRRQVQSSSNGDIVGSHNLQDTAQRMSRHTNLREVQNARG